MRLPGRLICFGRGNYHFVKFRNPISNPSLFFYLRPNQIITVFNHFSQFVLRHVANEPHPARVGVPVDCFGLALRRKRRGMKPERLKYDYEPRFYAIT